MENYKKMIALFEQVKDSLSEKDLQYALELIEEYDHCLGAKEAKGIENELIRLCSKKTDRKES